MTNTMCRLTADKGAAYFTCPIENYDSKAFEAIDPCVKVENWTVGCMPFEELPEDVKAEALDILKAFDSVSVIYENFKFRVSTGHCLRASYARDYFVCGEYKAADLYTKEQRRANFIESFGYAPTAAMFA